MSAYLLGMALKAQLGSIHRKMVLVSLVDASDDEGKNIFPGVEGIAFHAECSTRKVKYCLREFEKVGLIRPVKYREGGRGKSTEFELNLENLRTFVPARKGAPHASFDDALKGAPDAPFENPKGCTTEPKGCTPEQKRVHGVHPTPYDPLDPSVAREGAPLAGDDENGSDEAALNAEQKEATEKALARMLEIMGRPKAELQHWRNQSEIVAGWLREHDPETVLYPAVKIVMSRTRDTQIRSLRYFKDAIKEVANVRKAGGRLPGEKAEPKTAETLTHEEWEGICRRYREGIEICHRNAIGPQHMPERLRWPEGITPRPGDEGCQCPKAILARYRLIPDAEAA